MTTLPFTYTAALVDDDDGELIGYLLPDVPEDAPHVVREGLVRRRLTALEGKCPCGALAVLPNREQRRHAARTRTSLRIVVEHEDGCPAADRVLEAALRRWVR